MNEEIMKAELSANIKEHRQTLSELLQVLDLSELGRQVFDASCNDVTNRVLKEHEFYAAKDCARCGVAKGDRITDEANTFLLPREDWDRLNELTHPIMVAEGLTDERGYFTEDWLKKVGDARNELYVFICAKILPESMGRKFLEYEHRVNVVTQHKLIKIIRDAVAPAA